MILYVYSTDLSVTTCQKVTPGYYLGACGSNITEVAEVANRPFDEIAVVLY